jgi:hypothetical protein
MLARQITASRLPNQANSFVPTLLQPLDLSWLSFFGASPLFSTACSLFFENTRVGVSPDILRVGLAYPPPGFLVPDLQTFRPADATLSTLCFHKIQIRPLVAHKRQAFIFMALQIPPPASSINMLRVFIQLQIPFAATPLFSHPCKSLGGVGVPLSLPHRSCGVLVWFQTFAARVFSTNFSIALANPSSSLVEVT